mmetsp:Transcript_21839/g.48568  ORF Transcript_21839/g.48568 Transcript_21839/m.48568 type:complete len:224 (-) Transcript_21839:31-702(-)
MASTRPGTSAKLSSSAHSTKASGSTMLPLASSVKSTSITLSSLPPTSFLGNLLAWHQACTAYSASTCPSMTLVSANSTFSTSPNCSLVHHFEDTAWSGSCVVSTAFSSAAPLGFTSIPAQCATSAVPLSPLATASAAAPIATASSLCCFSSKAASAAAAASLASLALRSVSMRIAFFSSLTAFSASALALASSGVWPVRRGAVFATVVSDSDPRGAVGSGMSE